MTRVSTINLKIIAVMVCVLCCDVFAESDCLSELTNAGFDVEKRGYSNFLLILPKKIKTQKLDYEDIPNYKELTKMLTDDGSKTTKQFSIYSEGYYNHLLLFFRYEELMLTPRSWCANFECQGKLNNPDVSFGTEDEKKYFNSIVKKVGLQESQFALCTLYVCHAEIKAAGEDKLKDDVVKVRGKANTLRELFQTFDNPIMGFQRRFVIQLFKFNHSNRTHLMRTASSFCATELCYSELARAGFKDGVSAMVNKRESVSLIKSKPDFVKKLKGYAKAYLNYLNEHFNDDVNNYNRFSYDEYQMRKFSSEKRENSENSITIIGLESDHKVRIQLSDIVSIYYVEKYGLPIYEWCLMEICLNQLADARFVYDNFVFNFNRFYRPTDPSKLKFEFAPKYYMHMKRIVENTRDSNLPEDNTPRGVYDWCKFTVLWF